MAQQTALSWYIEQHEILSTKSIDMTISELFVKINDIEIQAKQMFQQQIEAAWKRGDGEHDKVADKLAKQYYTQTYTNE
jgi:hypothetical protein